MIQVFFMTLANNMNQHSAETKKQQRCNFLLTKAYNNFPVYKIHKNEG